MKVYEINRELWAALYALLWGVLVFGFLFELDMPWLAMMVVPPVGFTLFTTPKPRSVIRCDCPRCDVAADDPDRPDDAF